MPKITDTPAGQGAPGAPSGTGAAQPPTAQKSPGAPAILKADGFEPDYTNLADAARNVAPGRMPLYEHIIDASVMERITGADFAQLIGGGGADKREFFRHYAGFFREMGYDTVSFECCVPGPGALQTPSKGVISDRADFERYPWGGVEDEFWARHGGDYSALEDVMPAGMKAVGGVGLGVFENVQNYVGYPALCYIREDDPELYADLFIKIGDVMCSIWGTFLARFGGMYAVCRFGDDLGYKTNTLLSAGDIREHIIPQYRRVTDQVHALGKPFLYHSCGCIFNVMDDIIGGAKIDAKHSNEDEIAPFEAWVGRYGGRIGNFGGIDTDMLCRSPEQVIKAHTREIIAMAKPHGGFALGSGNSIPQYVPPEGYLAMVEAARESRGE